MNFITELIKNGYPNIFNHKDICPDIYRNVYICKVCEKHRQDLTFTLVD